MSLINPTKYNPKNYEETSKNSCITFNSSPDWHRRNPLLSFALPDVGPPQK
jgi:hypothetical protein